MKSAIFADYLPRCFYSAMLRNDIIPFLAWNLREKKIFLQIFFREFSCSRYF